MRRPSKPILLFISLLVAVLLVLFWKLSPQGAGGTQSRLPARTGNPVVALGDNHGVILASDGSLWTWGESGFGWQVLGLGSNVRTQSCLRRIGKETNWVQAAVGGSSTLALKSDGTLWAWGENLYGQLGDGTTAREQPAPVRSLPGDDWKQIAMAGPHAAALKRDGSLWCWGNNWAGQLGDGTTNFSRVPVRVGSSTNWTRIWVNLIQNVGQQSDGSLWFWGWDYSRSKQGTSVAVPTRVSADTNWVDVGMGDWMVFAIKSDGTLWAWGRNAHVYTGATNANTDPIPMQVGTTSDWLACARFAGACPLFMKRDGSLWVLDASDTRGVAVVTGLMRGLMTNNQVHCVADSTILGGDPALWVVKRLQVACEIGGTNYVLNFKENSTVSIGVPGQTLTIQRALYGDPRLFAEFASENPDASPARFRRVPLETNVVSFCGGRHHLGVALTRDGEVWTWGEALGQHTPGILPLQLCSQVLRRIGIRVQWGEPGPVTFDQPRRLGVSTEASSK